MAAAIVACDAERNESRRADPARLPALGRRTFPEPVGDPALDRLTRLAAAALGTSIAFLSLAEGGRQSLRSRRGLDAAAGGDLALCELVLQQAGGLPLIVADASADPRFADLPQVRGAQGIRFFAGAAIRAPDGTAIGTLCALDTAPRPGAGARDAALLTDLAQLARDEIERRLAPAEIAESARASADRSALRSEPGLTQILDTTADAMLTVAADGRIRSANHGAELLFGYPRAELIGRPATVLAPARTALTLPWALARCLRMTDPRRLGIIEMPARHRSGSELAVELTLAPCATDAGPGLGVVVRPVSLRKAIKADRQRSREAAELAARAKSDFLANMSHELRTPLNAIIGFSELLMDGLQGPVSERQREYLAGIHRSGSHLLAIVNDILDFAKIEAGRVELDERLVDVPALFGECAALLALQAAASGVDVSTAIEPGLPPILGDERLMKQILLNLLSNAVKFTSAGGRVTMAAAMLADGGMAIDIIDTGIGMAPDEIQIALEAFRQVDSSLTRRHDGTGLGLPIAKKLTELHGAELVFASQPRQGTTVTLRLPAWRVVASAR